MLILLAKAGASLLLCLFLLAALWQRASVESLLKQTRAPWLAIFYVVFRLIPFLIIYVALGFEPQSDVPYFYPIAKSAGRLDIPYRDVYSCYSPFFGHWLSIPLRLFDDLRTIVLTMTLVELGAVWLTVRVYGIGYDRGEQLFRCLVYYLLPVSFVFCVFSGQEDVALWGMGLLGVWLWQRTQYAFLGGVLLGLSLLLTKATFVLLLLPLWLLTNRKLAFTLGLAVVGVPTLVWLYRNTGTLFIEQQVFEGTYLKAPNWRSLINPWLNNYLSTDNQPGKWVTLGLLFGSIVWTTTQVRRRADLAGYLPMLFVAAYAAMSVLQQNAISNYAYTFMLPLVFCLLDLRRPGQVAGFLFFNLLAANHPSLWWRLKQPLYASLRELTNPSALAEYTMELLIVGGFVSFTLWAIRLIRRGPVMADVSADYQSLHPMPLPAEQRR